MLPQQDGGGGDDEASIGLASQGAVSDRIDDDRAAAANAAADAGSQPKSDDLGASRHRGSGDNSDGDNDVGGVVVKHGRPPAEDIAQASKLPELDRHRRSDGHASGDGDDGARDGDTNSNRHDDAESRRRQQRRRARRGRVSAEDAGAVIGRRGGGGVNDGGGGGTRRLLSTANAHRGGGRGGGAAAGGAGDPPRDADGVREQPSNRASTSKKNHAASLHKHRTGVGKKTAVKIMSRRGDGGDQPIRPAPPPPVVRSARRQYFVRLVSTWQVGWLVGWLVGWFVGSLVGWLVGWLVGR